MEKRECLDFGHYYHIYNRGNNRCDVFFETENYYHFLRLYAKYIDPVADTYAWCLLKNHFHFMVFIKNKLDIKESELTYSTLEKPKTIDPSKQFSHLFNAYTQSMNKRYHRTGVLFEKPFERKRITDEHYFKNLIHYIHYNPVMHGFVEKPQLYPWSSYGIIFSDKKTLLKRKEVIDLYEGIENFKFYHNSPPDFNDIKNHIIE